MCDRGRAKRGAASSPAQTTTDTQAMHTTHWAGREPAIYIYSSPLAYVACGHGMRHSNIRIYRKRRVSFFARPEPRRAVRAERPAPPVSRAPTPRPRMRRAPTRAQTSWTDTTHHTTTLDTGLYYTRPGTPRARTAAASTVLGRRAHARAQPDEPQSLARRCRLPPAAPARATRVERALCSLGHRRPLSTLSSWHSNINPRHLRWSHHQYAIDIGA